MRALYIQAYTLNTELINTPYFAYLAMLLSIVPALCVGQEIPSGQLLEDAASNLEDEAAVNDLNTAFDYLEALRRRPLNVNKAGYGDLAATHLFTDGQIVNLLKYRQKVGALISLYELQVVPSLDLPTLRNAQPYLSVGGKQLDDGQLTVGRMLREGEGELYARWQRRLENSRGYRPDMAATNYYLGDRNRYYLRARRRYGNRFSLGVTAEKDPGEPFLKKHNALRGFGFYSAHLFVQRVNRSLRTLAIGDYSLNFGQGLVMYTGFGFGKSIAATSVVRGGAVIRPYTGVSEHQFMRGAAATLTLTKPWSLTVAASTLLRGGNVVESEGSRSISSLNTSGLYRSPAEALDKHAARHTTYAARLAYRPHHRFQLAANGVVDRLSVPLEPADRLYNDFAFRGRQLRNAGLDYRYRLGNATTFGELAVSSTGGTAWLSGWLLSLHRSAELSVIYRSYGERYIALRSQAFGEGSTTRNERGLYFGLSLRPSPHWRINAYYDAYTTPGFRFRAGRPDAGREYRLRLTYYEKRRLETYLELRSETKGRDVDANDTSDLRGVTPRRRSQARVHIQYRVGQRVDLRARLDLGEVAGGDGKQRFGVGAWQEVRYRIGNKWTFSSRHAWVHTDSYDVRFYHYEQGLRYNARVVPYYGEALRAYLLARYKGLRNLTLEARLAQTWFTDGSKLGSGLDRQVGSSRTDAGLQVIWMW